MVALRKGLPFTTVELSSYIISSENCKKVHLHYQVDRVHNLYTTHSIEDTDREQLEELAALHQH